MIPKILHYGAFAGYKFSDLNRRCIESWHRALCGWRFQLWDDTMRPRSDWFDEAVLKCPINAHNYFLIWAIFMFGGVAVDNDVEILQEFDLETNMFVGFQKEKEKTDALNNAVIGAVAGHPALKRILDRMELRHPTDDPVWIGPGLLTAELYHMGMKGVNIEQRVGDVVVYDRERFYPYPSNERRQSWRSITPRTFAVHHWEGSWKPKI